MVIAQGRCYNTPSFLSYAAWQSHKIEEYAICSFDIFPDEDCGGEVMSSVNLPTRENKPTCSNAIRSYWDGVPEGSKSAQFGCQYFPPPGYQAPDHQIGHKQPH